MIKMSGNVLKEETTKVIYKFYDRDENCYVVPGACEEKIARILEGGRIYFFVPVKTPHYVTFKRVRRRPARVEVISTIERTEELKFF